MSRIKRIKYSTHKKGKKECYTSDISGGGVQKEINDVKWVNKTHFYQNLYVLSDARFIKMIPFVLFTSAKILCFDLAKYQIQFCILTQVISFEMLNFDNEKDCKFRSTFGFEN